MLCQMIIRNFCWMSCGQVTNVVLCREAPVMLLTRASEQGERAWHVPQKQMMSEKNFSTA